MPGATPESAPDPLLRLHNALARPPLWATVIVCAAILAARRPTELRNPQFWAEDGTVFFADAYTLGARALVKPYGGYLNTVQRIVAAVSRWADPALAPAIFVAATFALTLYVAARTQSSRFPFPAHVAFALAVVLVPDTYEVLLLLTNVQSVMAAGLLLLLLSADARRWWQQGHDVAAGLLLGLTGPFSLLFAPLFAWRAIQRRTRASRILAGVVIGTASIQGLVIWRHPGIVMGGGAPLVPQKILAVPGMRIGGSFLAGSRVPPDYPLLVETALGIAVLIAVSALASRRGRARLERLWLGIAFALLLAVSLYRCRPVLPDLCHAMFGSRYFYAPQLIVLWLLLALAVDGRRWLSRGTIALLVWILAVNVPRLREPGLPDLRWADYAPGIRAGRAVEIPINPGGVEPWIVKLPARRR